MNPVRNPANQSAVQSSRWQTPVRECLVSTSQPESGTVAQAQDFQMPGPLDGPYKRQKGARIARKGWDDRFTVQPPRRPPAPLPAPVWARPCSRPMGVMAPDLAKALEKHKNAQKRTKTHLRTHVETLEDSQNRREGGQKGSRIALNVPDDKSIVRHLRSVSRPLLAPVW